MRFALGRIAAAYVGNGDKSSAELMLERRDNPVTRWSIYSDMAVAAAGVSDLQFLFELVERIGDPTQKVATLATAAKHTAEQNAKARTGAGRTGMLLAAATIEQASADDPDPASAMYAKTKYETPTKKELFGTLRFFVKMQGYEQITDPVLRETLKNKATANFVGSRAADAFIDIIADEMEKNGRFHAQCAFGAFCDKHVFKALAMTAKNMFFLDLVGQAADQVFLVAESWQETAKALEELPCWRSLTSEQQDSLRELYKVRDLAGLEVAASATCGDVAGDASKHVLTLRDGSVLAGTVGPQTWKFRSSIGTFDVKPAQIGSFADGNLEVEGVGQLKGAFVEGDFVIATAAGDVRGPTAEIVEIRGSGRVEVASTDRTDGAKSDHHEDELKPTCKKEVLEIVASQEACGFSLNSKGQALLNGSPVSPALEPWGRKAEKLLVYPTSPTGRYTVVDSCSVNCGLLLVVDRMAKSAKQFFAGKYGPERWIEWSSDEKYAVLYNKNEGVNWLHVLLVESGEIFIFPPERKQGNIKFDIQSFAWVSANRFRIGLTECKGEYCGETKIPDDLTEVEFEVVDTGLSVVTVNDPTKVPRAFSGAVLGSNTADPDQSGGASGGIQFNWNQFSKSALETSRRGKRHAACSEASDSPVANVGPTEKQLCNHLAVTLPRYAYVRNFTVEASENVGNTVSPIVTSRMKVRVQLEQDLFEPSGELVGRQVIKRITKWGWQDIYYIASSRLHQGQWTIKLRPQSSEYFKGGQPRSTFAANAMAEGSSEWQNINSRLDASKKTYSLHYHNSTHTLVTDEDVRSYSGIVHNQNTRFNVWFGDIKCFKRISTALRLADVFYIGTRANHVAINIQSKNDAEAFFNDLFDRFEQFRKDRCPDINVYSCSNFKGECTKADVTSMGSQFSR
ncbi:MAG: hypothetical protein IPM60_15760 [Rhodospirillales bacterium]|nr:hypothetical protein [Rhodospirillales bacterium]